MRTPFENIAESLRQRATPDEQSWYTNAPCTTLPVDTFYTPAAENGNDPILNTMCRRCPVRQECLEAEFQEVPSALGICGYRAGIPQAQRRELYEHRHPKKRKTT